MIGDVRKRRRGTDRDADGTDLDDATVDLFGLGSPTVAWAIGAFAVAYVVVLGWTCAEIHAVRNWLGLGVGFAVFVVATAIVVRTRGIRCPVPRAAAIGSLAVCGLAMSLWNIPAPSYQTLQTAPPVSAMTIVLTLLALQGRPFFAWAAALGGSVVAAVWGAVIGVGPVVGAGNTLFCYPVMMLAMLFVVMGRPMEARIRMLAERAVDQATTEAATAAAADERNRQLRQLDRRARPILEQIVDGHRFTADEVAASRLTEGQLRDGIRAPGWDSAQVSEAVWTARHRGVSVLLLDDGALAPERRDLADRLRGLLVDELTRADRGQVTARIFPPERGLLATIVANAGTDFRRVECGADGIVTVRTGSVTA